MTCANTYFDKIPNYQYYTEATRFADYTTQSGGAIDVLTPVLLGVGGTDSEGIVTGSGAVITVNKTGPLMIKQNFQVSRNSNPGNAEIFFQAQASLDGGATWNMIGTSVNRRISDVKTINVFFDISPIFAQAGTKFRNVWAKSSVGGDPADPTTGTSNGQLIYTSPSAALLNAGMGLAPSAIAVVYKLQGYNYV